MDGQTVFTDTTNYAASAVATGTNKEINNIKEIMKQLSAYATTQAETVSNLSTKMNGVSINSRKTAYKKKARTGLHVCPYCKREVYHKDGNCFELEVNKAKRYPGRKSVFTKK